MTYLYTKFSKNEIDVKDDYSNSIQTHCLRNLLFMTGVSSENGFLTPIGLQNGKIQSLCNKQFYYIPEKMGGSCGKRYGDELFSIYDTLRTTPESDITVISEPVFYFLDFEAVNGTVHSYDLLFYLLYVYKQFNLSMPLVIPETTNVYFQSTCDLLQKYYNVSFLKVLPNKAYRFETCVCVRTYLNIFFLEVKDFLSRTLITPILQSFDGTPRYERVAKVKVKPKGEIRTHQAVFQTSEVFEVYCNERKLHVLDESLSEEEKIYYINTANEIIVCWGSIFYIYIDYYLKTTDDKYITVLFHKAMMPERKCLVHYNGRHYQQMNDTWPHTDQVYTRLSFQGKVIDSLETLDTLPFFLETTT
jgi:hypothetical protein